MTQDEWDEIITARVRSTWPKYELSQGMRALLWQNLQGYTAYDVENQIKSYARQHPDESRPKTLWKYVKDQMYRLGDQMTNLLTNEYGHTKEQIAAMVKQTRESTFERTLAFLRQNPLMSDRDLYYSWIKQVGYRKNASDEDILHERAETKSRLSLLTPLELRDLKRRAFEMMSEYTRRDLLPQWIEGMELTDEQVDALDHTKNLHVRAHCGLAMRGDIPQPDGQWM